MSQLSSTNAQYQPIPQIVDDNNDTNDESSIEPPPIHRVDSRIHWVHFIFGCAVLLPWNVLITATPYFLSRMTGSSLKSSFSSYLSITFTLANFCFLAHATLTSKQSSISRRTLISTLSLAILVGFLTLSTTIPSSPTSFFIFIITNGILQACAGSYLQTAVVATASLFGPVAMQSTMSGQAFVGVVVSLVQLLSTAASVRASQIASATNTPYDEGAAEARAASLFFGLSTLFLCATLGTQAWLSKLPEYKAVVQQNQRLLKQDDEPGIGHELDASHEKQRLVRVAKANLEYELAVAYVFVVTLAVFPPITASIQPVNPSLNPLLFTAAHFLIFNSGDLAGRYLCALPRLHIWSSRHLLLLSLLRTLFIPLFLLFNIQGSSPSPTSSLLPSSSPSSSSSTALDALFFLTLLLFGLSNGYVSSMSMIAAPSVEHNPNLRGKREDVDVAATIAGFCLVGGLVVGSAASFVVRARVCGCNPFVG
ncbi:nucleoside transporter [Pyrrhoderma noxium]|uniref:Nucleoside transporter n=1 Tax=Pyrrhoderma noxium TaxID=2282107 RepID=A0A286UM01_9AGAM|nr:nucleoside transporter [Pyrrhoderma noxium]